MENLKQTYAVPEMEVILFNTACVITTSTYEEVINPDEGWWEE